MQQVWISRVGDPSVLEVREAPDPEPGPGEVRVRVEASGVNFADVMARMGVYQDAPKLPAVVGYEAAGTIDKVGPGAPEERLGQPVVVATRFGGYSSFLTMKQELALPRPPGLDAKTAAAIPVTGLTAWMMLEEMARIREGDRVLVHSAGGGVGLMALDLIKRRKAYAIGTASKSKHDFLYQRGYDELIDYTREDYEAVLANKPPLDLVLDPLGGENWRKGFKLLRPTGKIVCYGFSVNAGGAGRRNVFQVIKNLLSTPWMLFNPVSVINANKGVLGVNMGRMWTETERLGGWLNELLALWSRGVIRPHVHAEVPFSRAPEAHRLLHARENIGKILLIPGG
jgi:NADPH:quinone reductase-like Zn-dependent oxidoreductase